MNKFISALFVIMILISACAPSPETLAKQTAAAAAATAAVKPPTPAKTPTPAYPTYSEVVSTYPAGAKLYTTDAKVASVSSDGSWSFAGGSTMNSCGADPMPWKCYGAKFTITGNNVTIEGVTYQSGAMLTVDKDFNWVQVSSWK